MARSLFRQFEQIHGTYDFVDNMWMSYAEHCGRDYNTSAVGVVTSGTNVFKDNSFTFDDSSVGNFVVVDTGNNSGIYPITGYTSNHVVTVSGTFSETTSALNYRLHYYTNLEDDLNYLRWQIHRIMGGTNWYDDTCTTLCDMANLIPKRPNYVGETTQYTQRPGTVAFTISDIDQLGYISTGSPAGEYTDGSVSVSAGNNVRFTDDNTMAINITGGFFPADKGIIRIYKSGIVVGELDLAVAWDNDNCIYETSESDVGSNPDYISSNTGTDIINLTNRRCMNSSVDGYQHFWPAYQVASMSVGVSPTFDLTLNSGIVGQIRVVHSVGGDDSYIYNKFWVDTTSQEINPSAPTVTSGTVVNKYLSGIPYADTNSVFNLTISNSDTLFDRGYVLSPVRIFLSEFNASTQTPSLATLGLTAPLDITDTIGTYNSSVTVGGGNFRDMDARCTVRYYNVFTYSTSSNSAAGIYRIDTYGNTSTDTHEYFDDEQYRFIGDNTDEDTTFNDTTIDKTDSTWEETTSILTQVDHDDLIGLVCYNGVLKYPSIDHSNGFVPSGPNYSNSTGKARYYRVFITNAPFTQGKLRFVGWSNALNVVSGDTINVHLRMPNCTDYSNNNTAVWQDLSVDQTIYGGNGCKGTGSSGEYMSYSFGTTSSDPYGNRIIIRITATGSFTNLQGLYFEPTI